MDLNSTYAPPINNACVPDIYNRLDADVIERTRVANKQLNIRLLLQQKILLKYKHEAERFLMVEKSRVARELARISRRLPTVVSLQECDESVNQSEHLQQHKKKSYMAAKNEDPVCRRCYIHHLPSKKRFYRFRSQQSQPTALDSKSTHNMAEHNQRDQKPAGKSFTSNSQDATGNENILGHNDSVSKEVSGLSLPDQLRKSTDRFIPSVESFKFLERDKWRGEVDPNHGATPRLMPNELWKNFVKTISSQCSRQQDIPSNKTRQQKCQERFFYEKIADKTSGVNSRRSSIISAHKGRERSEQHSSSLRKNNSRIHLYRGPSVGSEAQPNAITHSQANSTASMDEVRSNISAHKRPPLSKKNSFSRSLSRRHQQSLSATPR